MQNNNYCDLCLVVSGFYIIFASEYIFYIKLVMDNVAIYKIGVFKTKRGKETSIIRDNNYKKRRYMKMKVLFASLLLAASGQVLAQSSGQVGGLYPGWQEIYSKVDFSSIADNKKIPTGMLLPVGICFYINSYLILSLISRLSPCRV